MLWAQVVVLFLMGGSFILMLDLVGKTRSVETKWYDPILLLCVMFLWACTGAFSKIIGWPN